MTSQRSIGLKEAFRDLVILLNPFDIPNFDLAIVRSRCNDLQGLAIVHASNGVKMAPYEVFVLQSALVSRRGSFIGIEGHR